MIAESGVFLMVSGGWELEGSNFREWANGVVSSKMQ